MLLTRWHDALPMQAQEVARGLIALGVGHGDRVAIWSPNCTEWTILSYACFQVPAVHYTTVEPPPVSHLLLASAAPPTAKAAW